MPYSELVPSNRRAPLAWLGKTDWLIPKGKGYQYSQSEQRSLLFASQAFGKEFAEQVRQIIGLSTSPDIQHYTGLDCHSYAHLFFMASKALSSGQKTIRLSAAWCEAFENTELTLNFGEYRQPYQTIIVELPKDYVKNKQVPQCSDYPEYVLVHLDEGRQVLLVEVRLKNSQTHMPIPFSPDDEIETVLNKVFVMPSQEADYTENPGIEKYLAHFIRIALNAITAMTYGTDWHKLEPSYLQRKEREKIKSRTKSKDDSTARAAKLQLRLMPEVFDFNQTTQAFRDEPPESDDDSLESNGTPKKPHWRQGHWRRQPIGQGRQERVLRWICPILIHADRFKGDLKDTTTTYLT